MNNSIRYISALIFIVIGLALLLAPSLFWRLQYWFAVSKDSRPSKFYLLMARLMGAVLLVVAVVFLIMAIQNNA